MELMRIKPAAKRLKMNAQTLRRRIKQRGWPTYVLGPKCTVIDFNEVLRLTRSDTRRGKSQNDGKPGP